MKQIFLSVTMIAVTALMFAGCGNKNSNNRGDNDSVQTATDSASNTTEAKDAAEGWPWNYPSDVKLNAKVGQTVLCPFRYAEKITENEPNGEDVAYVYSMGKLLSVGDKTSKVEYYAGKEFDIPNSLILPIPEGQTAKKGDIVLTWWQKGSGEMQTAIVTDASDPTQPTVSYLDAKWALNDDGTVKETSKRGGKLEPNSFIVLKDGEVMVGQKVMYPKDDKEWLDATVVSISGDKALLSVFAERLKVAKLSDLKPIPQHQNLKPGDKVYGIFVNTFKKEYYKVVKVDNTNGRVWVTSPEGKKAEIFSILEVVKSL